MRIPVHHLVVVICPGGPAAASIRATPRRSRPRRQLIGLRIRPRGRYARRPLQPAPGAAKAGYFRLGIGQLLLNCGKLAAQRVDIVEREEGGRRVWEGGCWLGPPPPMVPLWSPPKVGQRFLGLNPRSKILAVSLKYWKGGGV